MSIDKHLDRIAENLSQRHRTREELLGLFVEARLEKVLEFYNQELNESLKFMGQYEETTVLRKM